MNGQPSELVEDFYRNVSEEVSEVLQAEQQPNEHVGEYDGSVTKKVSAVGIMERGKSRVAERDTRRNTGLGTPSEPIDEPAITAHPNNAPVAAADTLRRHREHPSNPERSCGAQ